GHRRSRRVRHRPPAATTSSVVRVRDPSLCRRPPGRAPAPRPVGGDPAARPSHRCRRTAGARVLELPAWDQVAAGPHRGVTRPLHCKDSKPTSTGSVSPFNSTWRTWTRFAAATDAVEAVRTISPAPAVAATRDARWTPRPTYLPPAGTATSA